MLENHHDEDFVQKVAIYVINYLKSKTNAWPNNKHNNSLELNVASYDNLADLKLACGITIKCPTSFFIIKGHNLQGEMDLLIFGNQNNARMKSRIQGALEEIPADLLPASLLNTIKNLILDRSFSKNYSATTQLAPEEMNITTTNKLVTSKSKIRNQNQQKLTPPKQEIKTEHQPQKECKKLDTNLL
jgi:hypothetical protein